MSDTLRQLGYTCLLFRQSVVLKVTICNSTICDADAACDGKKPGESCDTNKKCDSNCKCVSIPDTTPPTWDTTIGIQSATDTGKGEQVTVTYGTATDADSPPVKYNVYYSTSSPATAGTKLSNVGHSPYTVTGLTNGQLYYFTVRAEDCATPPNEDTNTVELTATPTLSDTTPPTITIHTPEPKTHNVTNIIALNVSADEEIDSWWYSLNSGRNVSFTPNTTITARIGSNELAVYATDTSRNIGAASISFTVISVNLGLPREQSCQKKLACLQES